MCMWQSYAIAHAYFISAQCNSVTLLVALSDADKAPGFSIATVPDNILPQ